MKNKYTKTLILICFICLSGSFGSKAQFLKKPVYKELTEKDLVAKVASCLRTKDFLSYIALFPPLDSMIDWTLNNAPPASKEYQLMQDLLRQPAKALHKDSVVNMYLSQHFDSVMRRGVQLGLNWESIVLSRYELKKSRKTRNEVVERMSPNRYNGYFFVHDLRSLKNFGIAIMDIQQINNNWYGGQIDNVYMVNGVDEYLRKKETELSRIKQGQPGNFGEDTTFNIVDTTTDPIKYRKVVVDRKLFAGTFDKDIKVELYIRYLRGLCPGGICSWDAVFRFKNDPEVVVEVTKTPDGRWHFAEEGGVMDLVQNGNGFTGTWTSSSDQTEYDAVFTEVPPTPKKIKKLDELLDDYEE